MNVLNVHERRLAVSIERAGALLDRLGTPEDPLWPRGRWPRMKFDRALAVGAMGGHGPIRYYVEAYTPGRSVQFRFTAPAGFRGSHGFSVHEDGPGQAILRHILSMQATGLARLAWPLVYRPLHDALIEDALACAQAAVGDAPAHVGWSERVRFLRYVLSR